jgi:hypothetical protein
MNKSLQMRKKKALDRMRDMRLMAQGKLRPEQVSLAAAFPEWCKAPLNFRAVHIPEDDDEDESASPNSMDCAIGIKKSARMSYT